MMILSHSSWMSPRSCVVRMTVFAERKFGGDVQTDRRLIEKEHFRRVEHGRHKIAFYPLPEGHLPYRLVDDFFDPQDPVQLVQRPVVIRLPDLINVLEQLEALAEAKVPVELRSLAEHDADVPHHFFPVLHDIPSVDQNASLSGRQDPRHHLDRRALPRAVGPNKSDDLPFPDVKRQIAHRVDDLILRLHKPFQRSSEAGVFMFLQIIFTEILYIYHSQFPALSYFLSPILKYAPATTITRIPTPSVIRGTTIAL